jgi:hypothetical protein
MTRFPLALLVLVLLGSVAHAEAPAADLQLSLRPAGYQLALSDQAVSGNAFSAGLVYRVTDPARSRGFWAEGSSSASPPGSLTPASAWAAIYGSTRPRRSNSG